MDDCMLQHFEASVGDIFIIGTHQVTVLDIKNGEVELCIESIDPDAMHEMAGLDELCL
jgi:hypothetical protein